MSWFANPLFAQAAQAVEEKSTGFPWYLSLLVAVAVIAVSVFLGNYLGKKLRMPDHGWKISLILFSFLASMAILLLGPPLKLGIDLKGGVILVYEVDQAQLRPGQTVDMGDLIEAIQRRVNPGGHKEITIRKYGLQQIEVIVPEVDEAEVQRLERLITTTGNLQFRILANTRDDKDLIDRALADPKQTKLLNAAGKLVAWWVPVKKEEAGNLSKDPEIAVRKVKQGKEITTEVLVLNDTMNITGGYLVDARPSSDEQGRPCVTFTFNDEGGKRFGEMTGSHLPDEQTGFHYKLAIILDDVLYSAPRLNGAIYNRGEISGNFTQEEVNNLVNVLKAGSLPAALAKEPISKLYSGPTLGQDTITKSTQAMIIASILIPLFMLWYYRFSGIVADFALLLNMMILFAIMLSVKAVFTLTGFAGLALTVGMAVDNNVLVFERLREELARGAALRMAIRNAFQRASTTIIDANLTTLIAATVLYVIGTDQVKGFAVPLFIGVTISMFTSIFVARVIFDIAEKRHWITEVKMMHLIGHTNIDFMRLFRYTIVVSALFIVMAIGVSIERGVSLFDIDFTGGVSVQAEFNQPQKIGYVRESLNPDNRPKSDEDRLEDLAITQVSLANEEPGLRFMINTSQMDIEKVKLELTKVFGDKLKRNSLDFTPPTPISSVSQAAPAAEKTPHPPTTPLKAEQPPAEKTSPPPTKATTPPASPEKAAPATPPAGKQSRLDLPSGNVLAFGGNEALALMLAADPKPPAADEPAAKHVAQPPSAVQKSPPPPKAAAPKAEPAKQPAAEKPQSAGVPPSKTVPRKPLPSEAAKPSAAGPQTLTATDPYAGGVSSQLTFLTKVNHKAVEQYLGTALDKMGLSLEGVSYQITNDQYKEGESTPYQNWTLKIMLPQKQVQSLLDSMKTYLADNPTFPTSNRIGTTVAGDTRQKAIAALVASWLCIIIYLWIRFQGVAFGLAAVAALIHDVFIMLGAVAVSIYVAPFLGFLMVDAFKINLPIVAAFLTIIGFSVNDTIVIFDRIREVRGKDPNLTREMVNQSTNQTLSRTLLTSFTVLLVVVVLYIRGGEAIHGFAFTLIVGVVTGTYSSVYIAAPILLWLIGKREPTKRVKTRNGGANPRQTNLPSRRP